MQADLLLFAIVFQKYLLELIRSFFIKLFQDNTHHLTSSKLSLVQFDRYVVSFKFHLVFENSSSMSLFFPSACSLTFISQPPNF